MGAVVLNSMTRKVMDCCLTMEISDVGDCAYVIETIFFCGMIWTVILGIETFLKEPWTSGQY